MTTKILFIIGIGIIVSLTSIASMLLLDFFNLRKNKKTAVNQPITPAKISGPIKYKLVFYALATDTEKINIHTPRLICPEFNEIANPFMADYYISIETQYSFQNTTLKKILRCDSFSPLQNRCLEKIQRWTARQSAEFIGFKLELKNKI